MTKSKKIAIPDSVRLQLLSLANRVSWLEVALKPKKKTPSNTVDRVLANLDRKNAEQKARDEAMREYDEQERITHYRENPEHLEILRAMEQKENAFLKSKGLRPNPSGIPKELRERRGKPSQR